MVNLPDGVEARHVRLKISTMEAKEYNPPLGVDVNFYKERIKGQRCASFYTLNNNPDPLQQRNIDVIDEALARLNVLQDNISKKDEPDLVEDPHYHTDTIIDSPLLEGEMDKMKSRAMSKEFKKNLQILQIPKEDYVAMNNRLESIKHLLPNENRFAVKAVKKEIKGKDGRKYVSVNFGRVI